MKLALYSVWDYGGCISQVHLSDWPKP
jgi:hypothetical protein